jgi:hypothetical protein
MIRLEVLRLIRETSSKINKSQIQISLEGPKEPKNRNAKT